MLILAGPSFGQKIVDDSDWCDSDRDDRDRYCEVREFEIRPSGDVIDIDASKNGGIEVKGWDRDEIRVLAKVQARGDSRADARDIANEVEVDIDGTMIGVDGPSMRSWRNRNYSVSFRVMVPEQSDLKLQAHNGGISVADISGEISFSTTNGGVTLRDLAGDVSGETTNGGLSIDLAGDTWRGSGLNVRTVNGGIKVRMSEDYSAELHMSTVNGGLRTDLPMSVKGDIGRTIRTTIGDGGPMIRLKTTNGGVRVQSS